MKKNLILVLLLLVAACSVFALPITTADANRVARNLITEKLGSNYTVSDTKALDSGYPTTYIYVINLKPSGFVLVAADDAATPIIGYSTVNNWGDGDVPSQLQYMLVIWNDQMHAIVTQRMAATSNITREWSKYNVSASNFTPDRNFRDVSPLLSTVWGQGTYYNDLCPTGTPVGCVATAMAQIMRYWSFPTVGTGTHTYTYGGITHNVDFGATTYNWAAMPNYINSANTSVATIGYHAGVSVNMQYDPSGSGAYSNEVPEAMINHFRYASTTVYSNRNPNATVWNNLLKGELDNARPVYYSGYSPGSGGHAWVLDGYSGSDYHVNWGWNGTYNGWYSIDALNPAGENFSSSQGAVTGIYPTASTPALTEGFELATFPPTGWTVTASTFARSTTGFISGTNSARYNPTATAANCSGKQLRTPKLTVNASSAPITFKAKRGTLNRTEQIKVGYSASATGPYTYLTTFTLTASSAIYTQAVTAITPGDYYFVLETLSTTSTSNAKLWVIDDVTGPNFPTAAATNLSSWTAGNLFPGDQASSGNVFTLSNTGGGTLTVTSVTNLGASEFKSNFNTAINLVYGQTHDFGFTYDPLNYGADAINYVIVTNAGTITIALSGSAFNQIFSEGFEGATFPPTGWTNTDADGDTKKWFQYSVAGTAHTGTYSAASASYDGAARTPNNWLITPLISLPTGNISLQWYISAQDPEWVGEKYGVYVSTTNTAPASFTQLFVETLTDAVWHARSQSLNTYAGQNVYLAFRHFECTDMFYLKLDDVAITTESGGGAVTFGNLSGYVYQSGTTTPISNALITVGTKTTYSAANGFYQITNLLSGTHTATCSAPGMFYHADTATGILISDGVTANHNFGLTWGELTANPNTISINLYQGETTTQSVTLANPGGTASTMYSGYITTGSAPASTRANTLMDIPTLKPVPESIERSHILSDTPADERAAGWFGYGDEATAQTIIANSIVERGDYFGINDIGLMDGAVTVSQLRHYFYNPSTTPWTSTTNMFKWKVYTVSPDGTVALVHTSAEITLPTTTPTNTTLLSSYTIPTALTIPAGYDFIVTVLTTSALGIPHSLITDVTYNNGIYLNGTTWTWMGYDMVMEAYVTGNSWLDGSSFSGTITPAGSVSIPLNFNTVGISAGTKYANMYVYNDASYIAPPVENRGDAYVIPISLTVTVASTPVPVLTGTSWTTVATVGSPSTTGAIFQLKNVGPGNLTITSATGLSGTPFTTSFNNAVVLPQNGTHDFGFTFTPTTSGIYNATFTIVTNGGTKTITLIGYGNYVAESFEGATFPPDGWISNDVDADTYNWMQYAVTGTAHTGLNCAGSASYVNDAKSAQQSHGSSSRAALTPNNWLITPRLAITTGDELSYWIAAQDPAWPAEYYSVKLSTTNNLIASFTNTLFSETLTDGTWYNRVIDLSAYAGQSVFIAFQHYNCTDQFVLKLDDVLMPPFAAPLVYGSISGRVTKAGTTDALAGVTVSVAGRTAVTLEDGAYSIANIVSDTYQLTATATGYIAYSASVIIPANSNLTKDVAMNFAEVYTANTTFSRTLEQGTSATITVPMTNNGNATLEFETDSGIWGGTMFPTTAMNQTFEDGDITGWAGSVGANSDIYGSVSTPYGHDSNNTWVFNSDGTTEVQYLISPKLRVVSGDNLAFWYKQFNASSETFEVRISTTDTELASFTTTLATIGPLADQLWTNYSASLNAYAGSDIYVMFYYPRTDGYEFGYIMIDDITGPIMVAAPTDWLSCTPVGYPVNETLAAAANTNLSLAVDATTLPLGTYTAQTWIFSNGLVSPYKLYVTLTVTEPVVLDPAVPENLIVEKTAGIFTIAWDESQDASSYIVYGCDTPYGEFVPIRTVADNYIELTDAELATAGLDTKAFFRVKASTDVPAKTGLTVQRKTSSHLHRNFINPVGSNKSKVLHKL